MDKLHPVIVGISGAMTLAVLSAVCAAAIVVWPDATFDFFNSWMHGLDLNKIRSTTPVTVGRFVYGLIGVSVLGFLTGVIFASVNNLLSRR